MVSYNVAEAKTRLSEILEKVSEGEEVILMRRGQAIARVVPIERTDPQRLTPATRALIESNQYVMSVASLWELINKKNKKDAPVKDPSA